MFGAVGHRFLTAYAGCRCPPVRDRPEGRLRVQVGNATGGDVAPQFCGVRFEVVADVGGYPQSCRVFGIVGDYIPHGQGGEQQAAAGRDIEGPKLRGGGVQNHRLDEDAHQYHETQAQIPAAVQIRHGMVVAHIPFQVVQSTPNGVSGLVGYGFHIVNASPGLLYTPRGNPAMTTSGDGPLFLPEWSGFCRCRCAGLAALGGGIQAGVLQRGVLAGIAEMPWVVGRAVAVQIQVPSCIDAGVVGGRL